jgi:hypothetical protein
MFNPNPALFLVGAKVEISPKGFAFTLGVKAEIAKKPFQSAPKLLINAELYGLCIEYHHPKAEKNKMDTIKFGRPICKPLGPIVLPFTSNLG